MNKEKTIQQPSRDASDKQTKSLNKRFVVDVLRSAKDTMFVDSAIHGGARVAGIRTTFIRTPIYRFKEKHPFWFWLGVIASIVGIISGVVAILGWLM